jgi:hypothetical protein
MTNLNWLSQTHLFNQFLLVKTTNKLVKTAQKSS